MGRYLEGRDALPARGFCGDLRCSPVGLVSLCQLCRSYHGDPTASGRYGRFFFADSRLLFACAASVLILVLPGIRKAFQTLEAIARIDFNKREADFLNFTLFRHGAATNFCPPRGSRRLRAVEHCTPWKRSARPVDGLQAPAR